MSSGVIRPLTSMDLPRTAQDVVPLDPDEFRLAFEVAARATVDLQTPLEVEFAFELSDGDLATYRLQDCPFNRYMIAARDHFGPAQELGKGLTP